MYFWLKFVLYCKVDGVPENLRVMVISAVENTNELLVERRFRDFNETLMVDWARNMLDSGYYAESLIILAGLKNASKDETEKYFLRSIEELSLKVPVDQDKQLMEYANELTRKVLNGEIPQSVGFQIMLNVARVSNKDFRYQGFSEIEDDLKTLSTSGKTNREGLRLDNTHAHIHEEFKLFSVMEMLEIPITLRKQSYCMVCGQLTIPFEKKKYQIRRPFYYYVSSCENCKSERLKSASQHFVKKKIIDHYASLLNSK
jgi:hypothetical protein